MKNKQFMNLIRHIFSFADDETKHNIIPAIFDKSNTVSLVIELSQEDIDVINLVAQKKDPDFITVYKVGDDLDVYFESGDKLNFRIAGDSGDEDEDYIADFTYIISAKRLDLFVDWEG